MVPSGESTPVLVAVPLGVVDKRVFELDFTVVAADTVALEDAIALPEAGVLLGTDTLDLLPTTEEAPADAATPALEDAAFDRGKIAAASEPVPQLERRSAIVCWKCILMAMMCTESRGEDQEYPSKEFLEALMCSFYVLRVAVSCYIAFSDDFLKSWLATTILRPR